LTFFSGVNTVIDKEKENVYIMHTLDYIMYTFRKSMLDKLFTSKARVAVLKLFLLNPANQYYMREVANRTGQPLRAVQRELERLTLIRLIGEKVEGNRKYYQINRVHPIYPDLKSMFAKTVGLGDLLREQMQKANSDIQVAFIFGSYTKGSESALSDIDLMVIGEISARRLSHILSPVREQLGREINIMNMTPDELQRKVTEGNHFILAVLEEPKIFLIGGENELRRVAEG